MSDKQLTVYEFAQKVKAKYPEYNDIDDVELAQKIIAKYPEYENIVTFEDPKKKKSLFLRHLRLANQYLQRRLLKLSSTKNLS